MVNNQPAKRGAILVVAASALMMLLLMAALTTFPFQLVRNADGAMEPALKDQQRLVVNKLIYRLRDPRSGEVVMMLSPLDPNRLFVRRVIGRAGDTVRIIGGVVYINGKPSTDGDVPSEFRNQEDWGPQVVPAGYYFVLSDNRNGSSDSRHWGFVPTRYIIGKIA
jgi:signal peptidase I